MLARKVHTRDHPTVPIFFALGAELVAWLYIMALMLLIGNATFFFVVWRRVNLPIGPVRTATDEQIRRVVIRTGVFAAVSVLLLLAPRALGVAALLDGQYTLRSRFVALVLRSEWGLGVAAMLAAALLSLVGYILAHRGIKLGWGLVLAGIPLVAIGSGLQGHPSDAFSSMTLAPIFDGLHAIGVGGWLGSFLMLIVAERNVQAHTASPWTDPLGAILERYFRISGPFAAAVLLSGLFSSATHLTGFDDIQGSQYGRLLAGKVGIVLMMMAFNEFHRRHAERQARTSERSQLVHTLRFQGGLIMLVLALTVLLIDAPPPGVNEVRAEVFRSSPKGTLESNDVDVP